MPYNLLEHPIQLSPTPSRDFSSTTQSLSLPDFDSSTSTTSSDEYNNTTSDDDIWDLVDSTYTRRVTLEDDDGKPLSSALIIELDGATFGVDPSTNRVPLHFPLPPGGEDDIPHFPPLTGALWDSKGKLNKGFKLDGADMGTKAKRGVLRTSEPISTGIQKDSEKVALGHITPERFQKLLDSSIGMVRFREWCHAEGYSGSSALLRYYQDTIAQAALIKEVAAITEAMNGVYFGSSTEMTPWIRRLIATRPTDSLNGLDIATSGMQGAQKEAFQKLYAAEFNRYITGKISAHARFCMEHYLSWQDRGDLATVYCLVDPKLPDQPMVMLSDGFCRLTEYRRETLIGRNCRFLQGPATDPEAVNLLRAAVKAGREHCSMLMNYSRSGKAFWNLFNMIPLRNAEGGIDYFLGAQVDISKPLTNPTTFQALTGIAEPGKGDLQPKSKWNFSDELVKGAEQHEQKPTLLQKLVTKPSHTSSTDPATGYQPTRYFRTDMRKHHKTRNQSGNPTPPESPTNLTEPINPLEPIPIPQEVPNPVRDHMSAFSSAYSKLLVFNPQDRKIMYITAPLLASLGFPVKTARDRLAPRILQRDLLELVTGPTHSETQTVKTTIRNIVAGRGTHSLFVQLVHASSPKMGRISEDENSGDEDESEGPSQRSLLHLTPIWGLEASVSLYIGVVG